jgi:hypothetical protein
MMFITFIRAAAIEVIALSSACNAAFMICSALLFLSLTTQGEITEAAPGQSVGSRLILESDGGADIFLEAPDSIADWVLVPSTSPNVKQMALKIWASTDWQIIVSCDRPDGKMAEYDLDALKYVPGGRALESPLHVSSSWIEDLPDTLEVDLPRGGLIRQGRETSGDGRQFLVALGRK